MELPLDPAVIGILGVLAVGFILSIIAVTTCCIILCNGCCRDGKHKCSIYHQQPDQDTNLQSVSVAINGTKSVKNSMPTLKDSVLVGEGPPTYQMATEYPRVYAGQYYIGMSGESEVVDLSNAQDNHLDSRQPPDYHLVVPY
jgi:hypothetical protein